MLMMVVRVSAECTPILAPFLIFALIVRVVACVFVLEGSAGRERCVCLARARCMFGKVPAICTCSFFFFFFSMTPACARASFAYALVVGRRDSCFEQAR